MSDSVNAIRCSDLSKMIKSQIEKEYPIEVIFDKYNQKTEEMPYIIDDCCTSKTGQSIFSPINNNSTNVLPENQLFADMLDREILLTMVSDQLNILGQTFRPIFCGTVKTVTDGFLTLWPVIIKMNNAPFHKFPTPLNFPLERISTFVPFKCQTRFPIP